MAHAFFAPSSAPRVVRCPGSLLLTLGMPDKQSIDAAHGTSAHWIADKCLRGKHPVDRYAGCNVIVSPTGECRFQSERSAMADGEFVFEVDDEMVNAVQEYVDWCNDAPGEKYAECRVDISRWCPKPPEGLGAVFVPAEAYEPQGGTSDHAACEPGRLIITDLKYGKGVKVYAENNEQAVLYALGFIDQWDALYEFTEIEIRICQPRLDHKDVWIVSREDLEVIGHYILERFTLALQDNAPFHPGEKQCKFCKASGRCRAQSEYLSEIRALAFENLDDARMLEEKPEFAVPDPRLLTNEELAEAWHLHGLYKARFDAIEREMMRGWENGVEFVGVKVVQANTHRQWQNEGVAADALELDIPQDKLFTKPSLISPSQAEKLLPKKAKGIVSKLAYRPRGGPCIVDASDKRVPYEVAMAEQVNAVFDELEDPFA